MMIKNQTERVASILWLILLPLEIAASILAYETLGLIDSFLLLFAFLFFNLNALIIYWRWFWPGILLALSYGLLITGYQTLLGIRWYNVNYEAKRIVEWVYSEEARTGRYPENLSAYDFKKPEYKEFITYSLVSGFLMFEI